MPGSLPSGPSDATRRNASVVAALAALTLLAVPFAHALVNPEDPWAQTAHLQDTNSEEGDEFGATVALDGDTMVVGHPLEDDETADIGFNTGAVTVYERVGGVWAPQTTFHGPQPLGRFGSALALHADTFVTNAPGKQWYDPDEDGTVCGYSTGELYIFEQLDGTWEQTETLQPPGIEAHHSCLGGTSTATHALAIDGDLIAAGTPDNEGKAFVYRRGPTGWSLEENLSRPGDESFGRVAISQAAQRLAVGSLQIINGSINGSAETDGQWVAARIYEQTDGDWAHTDTLTSTWRIAGYRVEISDDGSTIATAGSPWSCHPLASGCAPLHVWEATSDGWSPATKLWASDARDQKAWMSDWTLDARGQTLAVGTWIDDWSPTTGSARDQVPASLPCAWTGTLPEQMVSPCANGATHVFRKNATTDAWNQTAKIMPLDHFGDNGFGWALDLDEGNLAVGAPAETPLATVDPDGEGVDPTGPECCSGAAYVFEESELVRRPTPSVVEVEP